MRGLLLSLALLTGCAGGNYQLKGENKATPPQQVTPLPGEEPQKNHAKEVFPWVLWATIIIVLVIILLREKKSNDVVS